MCPLGRAGRNCTAMGMDNALSNRHAEARALRLGGEEGLENAPLLLNRQPWPLVADRNDDVAIGLVRAPNCHSAARGRNFERILKNIAKDLPQSKFVGLTDSVTVQLFHKSDGSAGMGLADEAPHLVP